MAARNDSLFYEKFKKKIKRVLIVFRTDSQKAIKKAREAALWLEEMDVIPFSHPKQSLGKGFKKLKATEFKKIDLVLVLGGDGTYLEAVRLMNGCKIPILGVNMGSLGFLTHTPIESLYTNLELTLAGKMEMRPRAMLELKVMRKKQLFKTFTALNDAVIERGSGSQLIELHVQVKGHPVNDLKADGLVISSPTGSTAYNLAAGGPILHPQMGAILVSPICPHSLTHRPIVFPDDRTLSFNLKNKSHKAALTVDGQHRLMLTHQDCVLVSRSKADHYILRERSHNYFDLLKTKLRFGERN